MAPLGIMKLNCYQGGKLHLCETEVREFFTVVFFFATKGNLKGKLLSTFYLTSITAFPWCLWLLPTAEYQNSNSLFSAAWPFFIFESVKY